MNKIMKHLPTLLLSALLALSVHATETTTAIEGDIQLKYSKSSFSDDVFKKEFGGIVKATTSWHAGEFFGKETAFAGIDAKNTSDKPMYFEYYVAFFDKDKKLVGAAAQGSFDALKPGGHTQLGSCLIHLPKDRYKDIASYQAVIYETDIAPKKK
jgi:hypothetical protein